MMKQPTMFYRPAPDDADPAKTIENEDGKWEWIIEPDSDGTPPSGWQALPYGAQQQQPDDALTELDALRTQASELGIKVDGRWSAAKIQSKIDEASVPAVDPELPE